ncbi:MAG: hypothetical protein ILP07_00400 [Treponema sp.]|nr:hypothetical protein [Treponema sp.]
MKAMEVFCGTDHDSHELDHHFWSETAVSEHFHRGNHDGWFGESDHVHGYIHEHGPVCKSIL